MHQAMRSGAFPGAAVGVARAVHRSFSPRYPFGSTSGGLANDACLEVSRPLIR
jgi:hypothetical protein